MRLAAGGDSLDLAGRTVPFDRGEIELDIVIDLDRLPIAHCWPVLSRRQSVEHVVSHVGQVLDDPATLDAPLHCDDTRNEHLSMYPVLERGCRPHPPRTLPTQ